MSPLSMNEVRKLQEEYPVTEKTLIAHYMEHMNKRIKFAIKERCVNVCDNGAELRKLSSEMIDKIVSLYIAEGYTAEVDNSDPAFISLLISW